MNVSLLLFSSSSLTSDKSATEESLQRVLTVKMAEIEALREAGGRDAELIMIGRRLLRCLPRSLKNGTITASAVPDGAQQREAGGHQRGSEADKHRPG